MNVIVVEADIIKNVVLKFSPILFIYLFFFFSTFLQFAFFVVKSTILKIAIFLVKISEFIKTSNINSRIFDKKSI